VGGHEVSIPHSRGRHDYRSARLSFWRGSFEDAAFAARRALKRGDARGRLILAKEALSRCRYEDALTHCEALIVDRILLRDAASLYWTAAKATKRVPIMRRVCEIIPPGLASGAAARTYVAMIDKGIAELCSANGVKAELAFLPNRPLPVVEGRAGAGVLVRTLRLMLDTGAETLCLSRAAAASLGLTTVTGHRGLFAGGRRARVEGAMLAELRLGTAEFSNVPVAVLSHLPQLTPEDPIDGIIGADILKAGNAVWDFAAGCLRLAPGRATVAADGVRLPARVLGAHIIVVRATLSHRIDGWFFLDSGGTFGVAPDAAAWKLMVSGSDIRADVGTGGGGAVHFELATGDLFEIAGMQFRDFTLVGGIFPERLKQRVGVDIRGIVSHAILSQFARLTIDFREPSVYFEAAKT